MWKQLAFALVLTCSAAEVAHGQPSASAGRTTARTELAGLIEEVAQQVDSAVVEIEVEKWYVADSDSKQESGRAGYLLADKVVASGTIISSDGFIVTNYHVVKNARKIAIRLAGQSRTYAAKTVGTDPETDLALLKIEGSRLNHFDLEANAATRQGDMVVALGNPFGFSHSIALGIVSSTDRELDDAPTLYIQTDASLNPGNSGGPLVDLKGRLLGINTLLFSYSGGSEGVGFAIPAGTVQRVTELLIKYGKVDRPRLGVSVQSVSAAISDAMHLNVPAGLLVADIDADGAAESAGIRPGDVILAVNGAATGRYMELVRAMNGLRPREAIEVSLLRNNHPLRVRVVPDFASSPPQDLLDGVDPKRDSIERLGVVAVNFERELRVFFPRARFADGVVIAAKYGLPTGTADLEPGDILHQINGTPVHKVTDLRRILKTTKSNSPLVLQVERDGGLSFVIAQD